MADAAASTDTIHARWGQALRVPLGLGTNTFGRITDEAGSLRVLDAFVDAGGELVDTADTYSDGVAESIIGHWLAQSGNRDRVIVVTKGGNLPPYDDLSATSIAASADASLRRLGIDHVDLYLAHYEDENTPVEESVAAFDALVRAGKVRAYGLSNFAADSVRRWIRSARESGAVLPVALQPHYSLSHRRVFEEEYSGIVAEEGLAVLPYRALGGGFLSGKYRSEADTVGRARGPGVLPMLTPPGLALLDALDEIAARHGCRPAAVALAWLLGRPMVTAPLVSATSTDQLAELVAAPDLVLDADEHARLTAAADALP